MALTRTTYGVTAGQRSQDIAISPATLADGTLVQRFDRIAFPQKGVKKTGSIGPVLAAPVLSKGTALHDPLAVVAQQTAGTSGVAEVDTVTITNAPASGTFVLHFGGNATTALARNASAAAVQTALNLVAGVAVTVTGSAGGPYTITWNSVGVRALFTTTDTFPHGTLAAIAYFWKITVVDVYGGERASNEVTATMTLNDQQPFTWPAVTGAASYKLYRGTVTATENKLIGTTTGLTITDAGAAGTTASPPANTSGHPVPTPARTTTE